MTFQTTQPLQQLSLHAHNSRAIEIARTWVGEQWLLIDPPYQRQSAWTDEQRIMLVRSWLTGVPIPAIVVNDRRASGMLGHLDPGPTSYALVDGRQRVETTVAWFAGDLAVPASWFPAESIAQTVPTDDGPYVTHLGLTRTAQMHLQADAKLPVIEANLPSLAAEAALYLTLNTSGTAQTDADLELARSVATSG